jgi:hypothetical protein
LNARPDRAVVQANGEAEGEVLGHGLIA